jgi:hypothetical protein
MPDAYERAHQFILYLKDTDFKERPMRHAYALVTILAGMALVGCRAIPTARDPHGIIDWTQPPTYILSVDGYMEKYHVAGGRRVSPGVHQVMFALGPSKHDKLLDPETATIWTSCYLVFDLLVSEGFIYRLSVDISDLRSEDGLSQGVRCEVRREEIPDYFIKQATLAPRKGVHRRY